MILHSEGVDKREIESIFKNELSFIDLDDLILKQLNYVSRMADCKSGLEYEEMHKLISLCDQIYGLEYLGGKFQEDKKEEQVELVSNVFAKQKKIAKMAAQDKLEEWKKNFWWYSIPLSF